MNGPPLPLPPPLRSRVPFLDRLRGLTLWGIALSLVIHLGFGPLFASFRPTSVAPQEIQRVSLTEKIKVFYPTPAPPPPPRSPSVRNAPPSQVSPAPKTLAAIRQPKALKLNVVPQHAKAAGRRSERRYAAPDAGDENGVPAGRGSSDSGAGGAGAGANTGLGAGAGVPPVPLKTGCANPHVQAAVAQLSTLEYPEAERQQGITGTAFIAVALTASGDVVGVSVDRSSGSDGLDAEALREARDSTYAPEQLDCKLVPGTYVLRVRFSE